MILSTKLHILEIISFYKNSLLLFHESNQDTSSHLEECITFKKLWGKRTPYIYHFN